MTIRFTALALLASSCAASAMAAAPSEAAAGNATERSGQAEAQPDSERKVCRMETRTGSNMPRRVCRTVAQMEADERQAEQFRDQQNRLGASSR